MYTKYLVAVLNFSMLVRAVVAYECTPCDLRTCLQKPPHTCDYGRTLAKDPCGCCDHCSRLEWEPCGGPDWTLGYCGLGLTCAAVNSTTTVALPEMGICKVFPDSPEAGVEDERCPLLSGCNRAGGQCFCDTRRACISTFTYPNMEACSRATRTENGRHNREHRERHKFVGPANPACMFSGCNLTTEGCVCESQSCSHHFTYINRSQCQAAAEPKLTVRYRRAGEGGILDHFGLGSPGASAGGEAPCTAACDRPSKWRRGPLRRPPQTLSESCGENKQGISAPQTRPVPVIVASAPPVSCFQLSRRWSVSSFPAENETSPCGPQEL